jgi:IS1 family transposase
MLAALDILLFCTDAWKAFQGAIPPEKHRIGKAFTKHIEGVNTSLQARNRRLVRKTTCFSKKRTSHDDALRLMFAYRNRHHTF